MGKNYVLKSIFWQICKIFSDINKSCKLHRSEVNFNKVNNKIISQGYPLNIRIFEVLFTFSLLIKKFKYKCTYKNIYSDDFCAKRFGAGRLLHLLSLSRWSVNWILQIDRQNSVLLFKSKCSSKRTNFKF